MLGVVLKMLDFGRTSDTAQGEETGRNRKPQLADKGGGQVTANQRRLVTHEKNKKKTTPWSIFNRLIISAI